jgi:hypothetical protein
MGVIHSRVRYKSIGKKRQKKVKEGRKQSAIKTPERRKANSGEEERWAPEDQVDVRRGR